MAFNTISEKQISLEAFLKDYYLCGLLSQSWLITNDYRNENKTAKHYVKNSKPNISSSTDRCTPQ